MDADKQVLEQERTVVGQFVRNIVQREAPQEVGILDTIQEEFYAASELSTARISNEQMFSFSGSDFQAFLAAALLHATTFVVIPFLRKVCEEAIDKTAEKSVDGLAKKIQSVLRRLKKKDGKALPSPAQIDLLVPIDWAAFERQIEVEGKKIGLPKRRAAKLANMTVKELSDNQMLLGDMLLTVLRVPLDHSRSKRP